MVFIDFIINLVNKTYKKILHIIQYNKSFSYKANKIYKMINDKKSRNKKATYVISSLYIDINKDRT